MQFLINVLDDSTDSGTAEEMAAIDVFNDAAHRRGALGARRRALRARCVRRSSTTAPARRS